MVDTGTYFVAVVLITNWTGKVGSYLSMMLLREPPAVARVDTLNHQSSGVQRSAASRLCELSVDLLGSAKLVQLFGNATDELLWLALFYELKASIQDAWRNDFINLALTSFETPIASLIDRIAESGACLVCVSSVSAMQSCNVVRGSVPKELPPRRGPSRECDIFSLCRRGRGEREHSTGRGRVDFVLALSSSWLLSPVCTAHITICLKAYPTPSTGIRLSVE
ncbi:hypothetical protein PsYK624_167480 [Phanerochaete sordida]|uniref:Uncharacterized protein n=1 Tax=Phanerochaete sordida TaxID=48140 RepID=A0A9P3GXG8_9APHY|nr:hypothetical protein PsYK624_167480 [Phanerochaete sordida]